MNGFVSACHTDGCWVFRNWTIFTRNLQISHPFFFFFFFCPSYSFNKLQFHFSSSCLASLGHLLVGAPSSCHWHVAWFFLSTHSLCLISQVLQCYLNIFTHLFWSPSSSTRNSVCIHSCLEFFLHCYLTSCSPLLFAFSSTDLPSDSSWCDIWASPQCDSVSVSFGTKQT